MNPEHAFTEGTVCYSSREAENGGLEVRVAKWGLHLKRLKMTPRHAFGQGTVCYSSWEAENGGLGVRVTQ